MSDANDVDDTAVLARAIERFPSLVPQVTVEPEDRYAHLVLTLSNGRTEAIWGDGYTRVHGEFIRYEGFLAADEVAHALDVLRMIDAIDGRIGRIEDGLVRISAAWTERRAHWWSRKNIRGPALRVEYPQETSAHGLDPTKHDEYRYFYVTDGVREEIERLHAGRFLDLGQEIPIQWLSLSDSAEAAERFPT
jgi:hypothetical protein